MEADDRFGFWIGGMAEEIEVAIWTQATDDLGARWGVDGEALSAHGDFAIVAGADAVRQPSLPFARLARLAGSTALCVFIRYFSGRRLNP